jgi:flagellar protein FlgJ
MIAPASPLPATATPGPAAERARLHKAAQAFEAIFVREMLSAARSEKFGETLWGTGQGNDTFTAMRDERFADIAAQTGAFGLGQQVEAQLAARVAPPVPKG